MHKGSGRRHAGAWRSRCFCCSCGKLSASEISFLAEILARRRSANERTARFLAVLSLFSAVLVEECKSREGALLPESVSARRLTRPAYLEQYDSVRFCQFRKCCFSTSLDRRAITAY